MANNKMGIRLGSGELVKPKNPAQFHRSWLQLAACWFNSKKIERRIDHLSQR
jgi:hypothetical protein